MTLSFLGDHAEELPSPHPAMEDPLVLGKRTKDLFHPMTLEEDQIQPKVSRRKERIKARAEINAMGNRNMEGINEIKKKMGLCKDNTIDRPLIRMIKERRHKAGIVFTNSIQTSKR